MQVDCRIFLQALGCTPIDPVNTKKQQCPLHPNTERNLQVSPDPITGYPIFTCGTERCGFRGDAPTLISRLRRITLEEAANLFRPNGEFFHTLCQGTPGSPVDDYLYNQSSQVRINSYLNTCRQALREDNKGAQLLAILGQLGVVDHGTDMFQSIPKSLGVLIAKDVPKVLKEVEKLKYRKGCYALYPYTFEGKVIHIRVQNVIDQELSTAQISIIRNDIGIFMEENIEKNTTTLFVTLSELTACTLYRYFVERSTETPPVVCIAGLPLPHKYGQIKHINIVSTRESPLTLDYALRLLTADSIIENRQDVSIHVIDVKQMLSHEFWTRHFWSPTQQPTSLLTWLIAKMRDLIESDMVDYIYKAIEKVEFNDKAKQALINTAAIMDTPAELMALLESVDENTRRQVLLANGSRLRLTPNGIYELKPNGEEIVLSNAPIIVDECVFTKEEELIYNCKVGLPDGRYIQAQLGSKDLVTGNKLSQAINRAALDQKEMPYLRFYNSKHCNWADIINRLAEGKRFSKEIQHLGADEELQIHFPNFILDTVNNEIIPQTNIFTLPKLAKDCYAGLRNTTSNSNTTAIEALFELASDNIYMAGFLAGICHFIHQILTGLIYANDEAAFIPRHLFYVEPEPGTWMPIFRQLVQLVTGCDDIIPFRSVKLQAQLDEIAALGTLPCIKAMPAIPGYKIPRLVTDSPVGLISLLDDNTASTIVEDMRVSFVVPSDYTAQPCDKLESKAIIAIQNELPEFILNAACAKMPQDTRFELRTSEVPGLITYQWLCDILKITESSIMEKTIKRRYTVNGLNSAFAFMHTLYELIYSKKRTPALGIRIIHGTPSKQDLKQENPAEVFITPQYVFISKQLVEIANRRNRNAAIFNVHSLTDEFEKRGFTVKCPVNVPLDLNRYWVLAKETWDTYVMKVPLTLVRPVRSGNILKLERISA